MPRTYPRLTAAEFAQTGEALFGAHWREELARALGLADDSAIRAVEQGRMDAPPEWRARLIAIAQDVALRAMDVASTLLWRETQQRQQDENPPAARLV